MSMTTINGPGGLYYPCPYDETHIILCDRFAKHLVKCRRQHPKESSKLVHCQMNACHVVPEVELLYHMEHLCEDHYKVNNVTTVADQLSCAFVAPPIDTDPVDSESTENWTSRVPASSYNPRDNIKDKALFLIPHGTKSERRQINSAQRMKFSQLNDTRAKSEITTNDQRCLTSRCESVLSDKVMLLMNNLRLDRSADEEFVSDVDNARKENMWVKVPKRSQGRGKVLNRNVDV